MLRKLNRFGKVMFETLLLKLQKIILEMFVVFLKDELLIVQMVVE